MQYKRSDRVAEQIRTEIGDIVLHDLNDPSLGMITITHVTISHDLRHAKIFYSVLGDEARQKAAHDAMHRSLGHFRGEIGHRIRLRFVPELSLHYDDSAAYADHINHLLKEIQKQSPPDETVAE
jgi:ribosome-binding factor A